MSESHTSVADLSDENEGAAQVLRLQLRDLGGRKAFSGPIRTVACHEDNSKVKAVLATPGNGAVLVVDGGGSLNCALVGDMIAQSAVDHGWAGVVVHGAVRDAGVLATLDLGVKALGTMPLRSVRRDRCGGRLRGRDLHAGRQAVRRRGRGHHPAGLRVQAGVGRQSTARSGSRKANRLRWLAITSSRRTRSSGLFACAESARPSGPTASRVSPMGKAMRPPWSSNSAVTLWPKCLQSWTM